MTETSTLPQPEAALPMETITSTHEVVGDVVNQLELWENPNLRNMTWELNVRFDEQGEEVKFDVNRRRGKPQWLDPKDAEEIHKLLLPTLLVAKTALVGNSEGHSFVRLLVDDQQIERFNEQQLISLVPGRTDRLPHADEGETVVGAIGKQTLFYDGDFVVPVDRAEYDESSNSIALSSEWCRSIADQIEAQGIQPTEEPSGVLSKMNRNTIHAGPLPDGERRLFFAAYVLSGNDIARHLWIPADSEPIVNN